ncbi:hypothetical protein PIB30_015697 [Stylosanthes scabra]|uniref:Uncharacterized protein n=1 Tax=Stylosanthes scabra TaxID=79078 RepID=A0ABU6V9E2_9FABA|nr:hypothetical protein [Stylosanthes scabra]
MALQERLSGQEEYREGSRMIKFSRMCCEINYKKRELPSVVQQHRVGALGKSAVHKSQSLISVIPGVVKNRRKTFSNAVMGDDWVTVAKSFRGG